MAASHAGLSAGDLAAIGQFCCHPVSLGMLNALLVVLHERWRGHQRSLPEEVVWVVEWYSHSRVLIVDGSTLDVLIRKIGLLCRLAAAPLAGKMMGMLDLVSRLPVQIWFNASPTISDQKFWPDILSALLKNALLLFDKGFMDFSRFLELKLAEVFFITRTKSNLCYQVAYATYHKIDSNDKIVSIHWCDPLSNWFGHLYSTKISPSGSFS